MRFGSGPGRRVLRWSAAVLLALLCAVSAHPARALTVTCIEASRYKHLYRIFDNDRARFAAFFGADENKLPQPETCRAVLLTGSIDRPPGDGESNDFDRLREAIEAGGGWLATLYLGSPGGNVAMGLRLANLTRMFWLNTYAVNGPSFNYVPDFLSAFGPGLSPGDLSPELQRGWENYVAATEGLTAVELPDRRARRCVSACTFIHTAGVYRTGPAYFHRASRSTRAPADSSERPSSEAPSMAEMLEGLQKTEERIVTYYRKMDAGDAAIAAYQSTAMQTTLSAEIPPIPRYIDDYLKKLCSARARPSREARAPDARPPDGAGERAGGNVKGTTPKPSAPTANAGASGVDTRQCLASANSREQRSQFDKLCYDGCDRTTLLQETGKRIRALLPPEHRAEPQRRRGRER